MAIQPERRVHSWVRGLANPPRNEIQGCRDSASPSPDSSKQVSVSSHPAATRPGISREQTDQEKSPCASIRPESQDWSGCAAMQILPGPACITPTRCPGQAERRGSRTIQGNVAKLTRAPEYDVVQVCITAASIRVIPRPAYLERRGASRVAGRSTSREMRRDSAKLAAL
jgi:hypothetical protein